MMGKWTGAQEALFYGFSFEGHVPPHHMLRMLIVGYFPMYNRNKQSICLDLKSEAGDRNLRLIYSSQKGFLPGLYENRTAPDEVAQIMGGLAHMAPPGKPLRAGST